MAFTPGRRDSAPSIAEIAASSPGVSGRASVVATTMMPVCLPTRWKDFPRAAAFTLGEEAGRNELFWLWETLANDGRKRTHSTAVTIQNAMITYLKRTENLPSAANKLLLLVGSGFLVAIVESRFPVSGTLG